VDKAGQHDEPQYGRSGGVVVSEMWWSWALGFLLLLPSVFRAAFALSRFLCGPKTSLFLTLQLGEISNAKKALRYRKVHR